MDFNVGGRNSRELTFSRALKPNEIKTETKNWSTIEGYVYIISKVMRPLVRATPLQV